MATDWRRETLQSVNGPTREFCSGTKLFLDTKQLIVLRDTVRSRRRTGLDLPCPRRNGEIGDEGVFRLARAMGDHREISGRSGHFDRLERLAQCADLVDLDQDRVGDAALDAAGETLGVGHEKIVAD